jgi:hypothetical protein
MEKKDWSWKFLEVFVLQGFFLTLITAFLFLYGSLYFVPAPAQVIASGSAGTWLLVGYTFYAIMIVYLGVSSFMYYMIERKGGKLKGLLKCLPCAHYLLVNLGIIGTSLLLISAGYRGGVALMPVTQGGNGMTQLQVHEQILGVYPQYVVAAIVLVMMGVLCGFLYYYLALKKK